MPQRHFIEDSPNYHHVIVINEVPKDGIVEVVIVGPIMPISLTVQNTTVSFQLRVYKGNIAIIAEILASGHMIKYTRDYLDTYIKPPPRCFGAVRGVTLEFMTSLLMGIYHDIRPMQCLMYAMYLTGENQNVLVHVSYIDDRIGDRIHNMFGGLLDEM